MFSKEQLLEICSQNNRLPREVRDSKETAKEFLKLLNDYEIPINNQYIFVLSKWVNNDNDKVSMRVKSITYIGKQDTYDIEVDNSHSYNANGIIAHNTINLPNSVTEEEVSEIYLESWKHKLKGVTVYRDGCRNGILVSADTKKEDKPKNKMCIDNTQVTKRPKSIPCKIFRFLNKGDKWVGVIGLVDNKPYEIFTGLLSKLDIPNWVEEGFIVKNKEKVVIDGEEVMKSRYDICYLDKNNEQVCVEGLSRTFNSEYWNYAKLISGLLRHHMPISYVVKVISSLNLDDSSINTWKNGVIRLLRKFNDSLETDGERCPECGGRLVRESGCLKCIDCGYSKCE